MSKKQPVVVSLVLIFVAAAIAAVVFFLRQAPSYLRGERDAVSPVLKPADLSARSFFLADDHFYLRINEAQPRLEWAFDRTVRGFLQVDLHAKPNHASLLTFAVTQEDGQGRKRKIIYETWRLTAQETVQRQFRSGVALAAGAKLTFEVLPEKGTGWPPFDIGITVPRIETSLAASGLSNLLIISIDALRSDFVGVYQALAGSPAKISPSPEIDRFAEKAVVFRNAYTTQSATWPALASLNLSQYPQTHGITFNGFYLDGADDSIALSMRGRGHAALALLSNSYELNIPGFEEKRKFFKDAQLMRFAIAKLAKHASVPFFHWYHLWGVHAAYKPPKWAMEYLEGRRLDDTYPLRLNTNNMMLGKLPYGPADVRQVRNLYAGALYYTDSLIKEIFAELKRRNLWDKTMIIVTADHGEELHDHNQYFYHNPSLYNGAIKIPLLIKFPHQHEQRIVDESVSLIDILPTIHDYFVGPAQAGRFTGLSLLDLLAGRKQAFRERVLFAESENSKIAAAIHAPYKLIFNPLGLTPLNHVGLPFPMAKSEFYDMAADKEEQHMVKDPNHPLRSRLLKELTRFLQQGWSKKHKGKRGKTEISDELKKQAEEKLRSLGYIR